MLLKVKKMNNYDVCVKFVFYCVRTVCNFGAQKTLGSVTVVVKT